MTSGSTARTARREARRLIDPSTKTQIEKMHATVLDLERSNKEHNRIIEALCRELERHKSVTAMLSSRLVALERWREWHEHGTFLERLRWVLTGRLGVASVVQPPASSGGSIPRGRTGIPLPTRKHENRTGSLVLEKPGGEGARPADAE